MTSRFDHMTFNVFDKKPEINLGPVPGKNICLTFSTHTVDGLTDVYRRYFDEIGDQIAAWVHHHVSFLKSPLHDSVRAAHPFVQSKTDDYLMIEFWTNDMDKINTFVTLLRGRFEFALTA